MDEWRHDPYLRRLRFISGVVLLFLIAALVLNGREDDTVALGTVVGALLVVLGFELGIRLPRGSVAVVNEDSDEEVRRQPKPQGEESRP